MTKLVRIATLTGVLAAVALPTTALAHGGPGHDRSDDSAARAQQAGDDRSEDRGDRREDSIESGRSDDDGARADRRAARRAARADRLRRTEFRGTVKAVDAAAETVTITVGRADRGSRALRGKDVVFTVATARLQVLDRNADGTRDLADLAAGDRIRVVARVSRRQLAAGLTSVEALRLKARAPRAAQPAVPPAA